MKMAAVASNRLLSLHHLCAANPWMFHRLRSQDHEGQRPFLRDRGGSLVTQLAGGVGLLAVYMEQIEKYWSFDILFTISLLGFFLR